MIAGQCGVEQTLVCIAVFIDAEVGGELDRFADHRRAATFHIRAEADVDASGAETKTDVVRGYVVCGDACKSWRLERNPHFRRSDGQVLARPHANGNLLPARRLA